MSSPARVRPGLHSLVVIARLLDYPSRDLQEAAPAMLEVIRTETRLPQAQRTALMQFVRQLADADLLAVQADYVDTFDRGRSLSLLLFEHVHGESRARGQAMVDLLQQYRAVGLELDARELPDYIPLYLEYLSTRTEDEAAQGLGDVHPILALLSARLQERDNNYHLLFDALLGMIDIQPDMAGLREQAAAEARDDTPAAMDAVWEEEMVNFVEDKGASCPSQMPRQSNTHTLHFQEKIHVTS
ncbi:MAG: nitrate reductase molybdenum cofactor assembly chaperone [Thiothrix sp.]|nr:nitrate reductase molybdenum cofactor assembly chaperone [Thiothrix sp.]HPE59990.1 nitrate reductase molybdenum cofactor assembly chaperone [Thiolinea sp.]